MNCKRFVEEFNPKPVDIAICSSMSHQEEWLKLASQLKEKSYKVAFPDISENEKWDKMDDKQIAKKKSFYNRQHFANIAVSKAILIYNADKKGIKNYIGANTFQEMTAAYIYGVPIYVYNKLPDQDNKDEILALNPVVIDKDLSKIRIKI